MQSGLSRYTQNMKKGQEKIINGFESAGKTKVIQSAG